MNTKDSLGDRMKGYESAWKVRMPLRMPVILRVDGKAFHTWTRGMTRPFDDCLIEWMNTVAVALCEHLQGAKLAYVQSDEISILLHNYTSLQSQAWFDNELQKMASVSASIAAATMTLLSGRAAMFDSRVFVLPEADVVNYFLWRQQDATRNSIQMVTRSLYSHKECDHKNTNEMQEMCFQKGLNWDKLPVHLKRGRCISRTLIETPSGTRSKWLVDNDIPIWKNEGREYVERFLNVDEPSPTPTTNPVVKAENQ